MRLGISSRLIFRTGQYFRYSINVISASLRKFLVTPRFFSCRQSTALNSRTSLVDVVTLSRSRSCVDRDRLKLPRVLFSFNCTRFFFSRCARVFSVSKSRSHAHCVLTLLALFGITLDRARFPQTLRTRRTNFPVALISDSLFGYSFRSRTLRVKFAAVKTLSHARFFTR